MKRADSCVFLVPLLAGISANNYNYNQLPVASRGQHITGKQLNIITLKLYFPSMLSLGVVSSFTDTKM